jgi:hypothetical protein
MSYDPNTLRNTYAYRHEVETAEAQRRSLLPKKTPIKEEPKKPDLSALLDKFKKH